MELSIKNSEELDCFRDYVRPKFSSHFSSPFFSIKPKTKRPVCVKQEKGWSNYRLRPAASGEFQVNSKSFNEE